MLLARLPRLGDLKAVRVPSADDEAVRDLVRAREALCASNAMLATGCCATTSRAPARAPGPEPRRAGWRPSSWSTDAADRLPGIPAGDHAEQALRDSMPDRGDHAGGELDDGRAIALLG